MAGKRAGARAIAVCVMAMALMLAAPARQAAAAGNGLIGGVGDLLGGVMSIPMGILAGTMSGPPILGTVGGALAGSLNALSLTTRGVLKLVGVAIPTAAAVAPYIPLFL